MKRKIPRFILLVPSFLLLVSFATFFNDWQLLETKSYKIYFPENPVEETRFLDLEIGKIPIVGHIFKVKNHLTNDNVQYGIFEIIYPVKSEAENKALSDSLFLKFVDGIAEQLDGALVSEKAISISGHQGREIKVSIKNGQLEITMHAYLVQNIAYMLQVMTPAAKKNNQSIYRFMKSFTLKT